MKSIYRRHLAGGMNSPIYYQPSLVGINDAYLRALFKQEIGVSIKEYVIRIRMDKALELLKHSNYNINEIARMIGYPDYRLFVDVFKKRIGLSPSQYRKASDQKKK